MFASMDNTCDRVGTAEGSKSSQLLGSIGTQTRPAETFKTVVRTNAIIHIVVQRKESTVNSEKKCKRSVNPYFVKNVHHSEQ
jgi:hypothetical protein